MKKHGVESSGSGWIGVEFRFGGNVDNVAIVSKWILA
jgi:hypothetical protein